MYAKIYFYTNKNVIENIKESRIIYIISITIDTTCQLAINLFDVYTIHHCICQNIKIIFYLQMIRHVNKIYLTHVSSKSVVALTSDTQVEIKTLWCCTIAGGMNSTI